MTPFAAFAAHTAMPQIGANARREMSGMMQGLLTEGMAAVRASAEAAGQDSGAAINTMMESLLGSLNPLTPSGADSGGESHAIGHRLGALLGGMAGVSGGTTGREAAGRLVGHQLRVSSLAMAAGMPNAAHRGGEVGGVLEWYVDAVESMLDGVAQQATQKLAGGITENEFSSTMGSFQAMMHEMNSQMKSQMQEAYGCQCRTLTNFTQIFWEKCNCKLRGP